MCFEKRKFPPNLKLPWLRSLVYLFVWKTHMFFLSTILVDFAQTKSEAFFVLIWQVCRTRLLLQSKVCDKSLHIPCYTTNAGNVDSSRNPETGGGESPISFEGRMEAGIEAAGETIQTNLFFQTVGKKHTFFFQIFKGSLRDDDVSPASDKLWWMDLFVSVVQENLLLEYDKICKMYYFLLFICLLMKS